MPDDYHYDPRDHYWLVTPQSKIWSSAQRSYVANDDADYVNWLAAGWTPTRIASEDELWDVLAAAAPDRVPDDAAAQSRLSAWQFSRLPPALHALLFDQGNRLRALEGKPALDPEQYRAAGKAAVRDNYADVAAAAAASAEPEMP